MITLETKYGTFTTDAPKGAQFQIGDRVHSRGMIGSRYDRVGQYYVRKSPESGFCYVLQGGGMFSAAELTPAR